MEVLMRKSDKAVYHAHELHLFHFEFIHGIVSLIFCAISSPFFIVPSVILLLVLTLTVPKLF